MCCDDGTAVPQFPRSWKTWKSGKVIEFVRRSWNFILCSETVTVIFHGRPFPQYNITTDVFFVAVNVIRCVTFCFVCFSFHVPGIHVIPEDTTVELIIGVISEISKVAGSW